MQLILFDGAKNWLQKMGIRPNITELDQVNSDIKALESKESELEKKRNEARKAVRDLEQKYRNITEYLEINKDERNPDHTKEKTFSSAGNSRTLDRVPCFLLFYFSKFTISVSLARASSYPVNTIPFNSSFSALTTFSSVSSINTHSSAFRLYLLNNVL